MPYGKRTVILVRGVETLRKELVDKKGSGSELEESQEGESKEEMVGSINKLDRACIAPPFCKK